MTLEAAVLHVPARLRDLKLDIQMLLPLVITGAGKEKVVVVVPSSE